MYLPLDTLILFRSSSIYPPFLPQRLRTYLMIRSFSIAWNVYLRYTCPIGMGSADLNRCESITVCKESYKT